MLLFQGAVVTGELRLERLTFFSRVHAASPTGLLDRAFYARVTKHSKSQARFNGLMSQASAVMLKLLIQSTLEAR